MSFYLIEFFKYYSIYIISLLFILLVGSVFLHFFKFKFPSSPVKFLFIAGVVGMVIIVFFYSILITKGKTINIAMIPLFIMAILYKDRYKLKEKGRFLLLFKNKILSQWKEILFFSLLLFSYQYFFLYDFSNFSFPYNPIHKDYCFYADIADILNLTGQENTFTVSNLFFPEFHGVTPYHYFEIYLLAFWANIFSFPTVFLEELVLTPIFYLFLLWGIFYLGEERLAKELSFKEKLWGILFLFLGVLVLPVYKYIPKINKLSPYIFKYPMSYVTSFKISILYIFFISLFLSFLKKRYDYFFILLFLLPIISVSSITFSFITGWFYLYYWGIKKRKISFKRYFSFAALFWLVFFGTYLLGGVKVVSPIKNSFLFSFSLTSVNIIVLTTIQTILLYGPYFIFINWNDIKKKKGILLLLLLAYVVPLFSWALMYKIPDIYEFFFRTFIVLLNISFIFALFSVFYNSKALFILFLYNFCFLLIWKYNFILKMKVNNNYYFRKKVYISFKNENYNYNFIGVFLKNFIKGGIEYQALKDYLKITKKKAFSVCLNPHSLGKTLSKGSLAEKRWKFALTTSTFYFFMKKYGYKDILKAQVAFIKKYKLKFLIVEKGVEINELLSCLKVKDIITDSKSGERFVVLDN